MTGFFLLKCQNCSTFQQFNIKILPWHHLKLPLLCVSDDHSTISTSLSDSIMILYIHDSAPKFKPSQTFINIKQESFTFEKDGPLIFHILHDMSITIIDLPSKALHAAVKSGNLSIFSITSSIPYDKVKSNSYCRQRYSSICRHV